MDGTGRLDLWNLNSDTEVPTASVVVEGAPALNRVSWTQSGLHVTAGDDSGKIWVYDVGEQLAMPTPDEWSKFAYTLQVCMSALNSSQDPEPGFYKHLEQDMLSKKLVPSSKLARAAQSRVFEGLKTDLNVLRTRPRVSKWRKQKSKNISAILRFILLRI